MLFYSAKSNSDHVNISNFSSFFFKTLIFFAVSTPYTAQVRKVKSAKNHFQCSFIVQNPFQTTLRFQNFFKFLLKNQFFSLFQTLYCKGEKHQVRKKSFLVQNPIQTVLRFQIFQIFFEKLIFILFRPPILHK